MSKEQAPSHHTCIAGYNTQLRQETNRTESNTQGDAYDSMLGTRPGPYKRTSSGPHIPDIKGKPHVQERHE